MRKRCAVSLLVPVALVVLIVLGSGSFDHTVFAQTLETVIKSNDGLSQISVPPGWKQQTKLNEIANLQAAYPVQEMYVIGITEPKADFAEMTLDKYSELTRNSLINSLTSPQIDKMPKLTVGGKPAVQYKIRGTIKNMNIVYLHTAIETEKHYHYLLAWTLKSRYEKNEPVLQRVIGSFKEIK